MAYPRQRQGASAIRVVDSTTPSPIRQELEPALAAARSLPMEELPRLIGDLEQIRVIALARLTAPATVSRADELVGIEEASRRLNISKSYLYRHWGQLPFARHIGRKLVFSSLGIDRYITVRR
jgi:hypothetical protein